MKCHAPESITLYVFPYVGWEEVPKAFFLLVQTVPVTIRKLIFQLNSPEFDSEGGLYELELRKIDTIFSKYTNLELVKFEIRVNHQSQYSEVQACIIKGLPELHRQGLLKFKVCRGITPDTLLKDADCMTTRPELSFEVSRRKISTLWCGKSRRSCISVTSIAICLSRNYRQHDLICSR